MCRGSLSVGICQRRRAQRDSDLHGAVPARCEQAVAIPRVLEAGAWKLCAVFGRRYAQ